MMSLPDYQQDDIIDAFNTTSRYLDDIINIDHVYFDTMISQIYPSELQLNKANTSDTEAAFLDVTTTLRDVSYNARWFWTTIHYGPMTTAYLCWTTGNGLKMTDLGFWTTVERGNTHRRHRK